MKSLLIVCALVFGTAAYGQQDTRRDIAKLEGRVAISKALKDAQSRGDLELARQIVVTKLIPAAPNDAGSYLKASKLCFEQQDLGMAQTYYKDFVRLSNGEAQSAEALVQDQVYRLLLDSARSKSPVDWRKLNVRGSDVDVLMALDVTCQTAISSHYFQTAKMVLQEIARLPGSSGKVEALNRLLRKKIADQKAHT